MDFLHSIGQNIYFFARTRVRIRSRAIKIVPILAILCAWVTPSLHADEKAFKSAIKNVSHKDLGVSLSAVNLLGRAHDERAVNVLSQAYAKETRMPVRRAIVDAIGLLRLPSCQPALIQALQDPDAQVRQSAVIALEGVGGKDSEEALLQQVDQEPELAVKSHLVQVLGRSHHPRAQEGLNKLATDASPELQRLAKQELKKRSQSKKK